MLVICAPILVLSVILYGMEKYYRLSKHLFSTPIIVLLVYVMVAGNYQNADILNYKTSYDANTPHGLFQPIVQWVYFGLINVCNFFKLSFVQYRFVVYGIGFLALITAIYKVGLELYPVFLLYGFYSMIIDATQMKNFVAMCFVTLAVTFLIRGRRIDQLWFLVCLFIALGFHVTAIAFIPLIVLCNNNYDRRIKLVLVLMISMFAVLFSNRVMIDLLSHYIMGAISGSFDRAESYLMSRMKKAAVIFMIPTIAFIVMVIKMRLLVLKSRYSTAVEKKYSDVVLYSSLYTIVFIPLYFIKTDFARFLRMMVPEYHMLFVITLKVFKRDSDLEHPDLYKALFIGAYLFILLYMFYWEIYVFKDSVFIPFFDYNIIAG